MKIESKSIIKDSFELDGKVIPFTIHLTKSAREINAKRAELQTVTDDDVALGKKIVELYTLIFGEHVVEELLDYYEGDEYGLMVETLPVLTDIVFPAFEQMSKDAMSKKMRFKNNG